MQVDARGLRIRIMSTRRFAEHQSFTKRESVLSVDTCYATRGFFLRPTRTIGVDAMPIIAQISGSRIGAGNYEVLSRQSVRMTAFWGLKKRSMLPKIPSGSCSRMTCCSFGSVGSLRRKRNFHCCIVLAVTTATHDADAALPSKSFQTSPFVHWLPASEWCLSATRLPR
jgi:hypothetical protein